MKKFIKFHGLNFFIGLGISRTRLDSLPSVSGIGADGGRVKSSANSQIGRKIPAANGLRRNPAVDSDAKSILSSRSGGSRSGGGKDSRYHLNTGQPVVSIVNNKISSMFIDFMFKIIDLHNFFLLLF